MNTDDTDKPIKWDLLLGPQASPPARSPVLTLRGSIVREATEQAGSPAVPAASPAMDP